MKLDVMKTINDFKDKGKVSPYYDLYNTDLDVIRNNGDCLISTFYNCFIFGYAQGQKALKAEQRKKGIRG